MVLGFPLGTGPLQGRVAETSATLGEVRKAEDTIQVTAPTRSEDAEPQLGMAQIYAAGFHDADRALSALERACQLGLKESEKEKAREMEEFKDRRAQPAFRSPRRASEGERAAPPQPLDLGPRSHVCAAANRSLFRACRSVVDQDPCGFSARGARPANVSTVDPLLSAHPLRPCVAPHPPRLAPCPSLSIKLEGVNAG
ncbi:MAG: hypothetical protein HYZ53_12370 [Planctomycetes bacterium]|nr:hypothetical protein [Planctomycetota bacterium]